MRNSRQPVPPSARAEPPAQPYSLVIEHPSRAQRVHDWFDEHFLGLMAVGTLLIFSSVVALLAVSARMSLVDTTTGQIVLDATSVGIVVGVLLLPTTLACVYTATLGQALRQVALLFGIAIVVIPAIGFIVGRL